MINKCSCVTCRQLFSASRINRHTNCKPHKCKFCGVNLEEIDKNKRASHVKWCLENPNRDKNLTSIKAARLSSANPETAKKISKSIKTLHENGFYSDTYKKLSDINKSRVYHHSNETRLKISQAAKKSNHQRVCKSTHPYIDKNGRIFKFDSTWEDALADRLDFLDIKWERPSPIEYTLPNETQPRKYYADFYLPDYNLYLDPKNPYCCEQQKEKITILQTFINLKILHSLSECHQFTI